LKTIFRLSSFALLIVGVSALTYAQTQPTPEINPGTGMNALALLAGAALVVRARLKR